MTTEANVEQSSRWDISNIYSELNGTDFRADFALLETRIESLANLFDQRQVRRLAERPAADDALADLLVEAIGRVNEIALLVDLLDSFVHALVTTDSYNSAAQREASKLELLDTRRRLLLVRFQGWIGSLAPLLPELIARRGALTPYQYFLSDAARRSRYLMSEEMEALAAELCLDAGGAFGKLQGNVTSQLKVLFDRDGKSELLPITVIRNFVYDPDPAVRRQAYEAEQLGWASVRTTVAACLNGVKGTAQTLCRRRGRDSVLDAALEQNRIDRATLDALLLAIDESLPMFRRYLKGKAGKLGQSRLNWWDLFAPLGSVRRTFTWAEARDLIVERFGRFSPELADYAQRAFDRRWIDAEPRDGKRGGAYCMGIMAREESRILANFDGSFDQVSTLAHELGHGFHNHCQTGLEPLRRGAPSTLAETASIFCETLIAEAALEDASADERLMILEAQLSGATQVCLDIRSRILFESAVFERRATSELSADEFCELMLAAQRQTYGDGIVESTYHRYMWLWKPHYYSYDHNFYNFPYAFGHLFGLGLWSVYQTEGDDFVPRYKQLLRSTGEDDAAPLAARFGIDITRPEFWRQSLAVVARQVEQFEAI